MKSFGLVYYRKDKNTRSLFESLLIWGDIVARRNSITCAILSIPTESRFTNALERSPRTFTSSIITATVAGNFGIFFDVWSTEWNWGKIQVLDISSFLQMALSLLYLWVFQYIRGWREGAIWRREVFMYIIKKYNIASSFIFDNIVKLKLKILPKDRNSSTLVNNWNLISSSYHL